jgi:hypothetical protein
MACFVVFYPTRVICKGQRTMEAVVYSLKHDWRFVDAEARALQGLSWGTERNVA